MILVEFDDNRLLVLGRNLDTGIPANLLGIENVDGADEVAISSAFSFSDRLCKLLWDLRLWSRRVDELEAAGRSIRLGHHRRGIRRVHRAGRVVREHDLFAI